LKLRVPP